MRPAPFKIYGACISSVSRARLIFPQARQAKTVNSKAITTPGKTMPPNAVWELKLLMPYIRISTATIGSVPTARKAVRAHKRNQQKPQGKAAAQGGARQTHGAVDVQALPFALHKLSAGEQGNHQHDIRQQGPSSRGTISPAGSTGCSAGVRPIRLLILPAFIEQPPSLLRMFHFQYKQ